MKQLQFCAPESTFPAGRVGPSSVRLQPPFITELVGSRGLCLERVFPTDSFL